MPQLRLEEKQGVKHCLSGRILSILLRSKHTKLILDDVRDRRLEFCNVMNLAKDDVNRAQTREELEAKLNTLLEKLREERNELEDRIGWLDSNEDGIARGGRISPMCENLALDGGPKRRECRAHINSMIEDEGFIGEWQEDLDKTQRVQ